MNATLRRYFQQLGRKGGTARAKKLTKAQRRTSARRAARARWHGRTETGA